MSLADCNSQKLQIRQNKKNNQLFFSWDVIYCYFLDFLIYILLIKLKGKKN